jgi:hypothetical protein
MATPNFNGLFKGPDENDIYALQKQERDAKIRQAMADSSGAGGNFYANLQAKANEQLSQSLQGGARTLLQGTALAPPEDPRLAKARKRDTDKTEIVAILAKYSDPASDGGKQVTEKEMNIGFSELMSRGYVQEAKDFLGMAQSMVLTDAKKNTSLAALQKAVNAGGKGGQLKFEGNVMKAKDGTLWQSASTVGGVQKFMKLAGPEGATYDPDGAVIVDTKGQVFIDRVNEAKAIDMNKTTQIGLRDQYKSQLAISKDKAKAFLDRRTNELQSELGITSDIAKKRAGAELITEREFITGGSSAVTAIPKAQELLDIVDSNMSGGAFAAKVKDFKRIFNITGSDEEIFRTGTQMLLLQLLKPLMGTKATDQDLIELKEALANPQQSTDGNKAILTRFVRQLKRDVYHGKYFRDDTEANISGLFKLKEKISGLPANPTFPVADRPVNEIINVGGVPVRWNGTSWDNIPPNEFRGL